MMGAPTVLAQNAGTDNSGGSGTAAAPTSPVPNFCIYRCDNGMTSPTDSDEYGKWVVREQPLNQCSASCASQCENDCQSRPIQPQAANAGPPSGQGSGQAGSRRRTTSNQNTVTNPGVQRCSSTPNALPICTDERYTENNGVRPASDIPQLCIYRCPGTNTFKAKVIAYTACTQDVCQLNCALDCGATSCSDTETRCQPLPDHGTPRFLAGANGAAGGAAPEAQPTPSVALRAGTIGAYGLKDPLGGVSVQRLIAGLITYVLGFVGALFFGMFVYGGMLWMTAGGEMDRVKQGKATLVNAVIGLLIVLASWTLVSLILEVPNLIAPTS